MFDNSGQQHQQFSTIYKSCYLPVLHSYHRVIAQNNISKEFVTALLIEYDGNEVWIQSDQTQPCV